MITAAVRLVRTRHCVDRHPSRFRAHYPTGEGTRKSTGFVSTGMLPVAAVGLVSVVVSGPPGAPPGPLPTPSSSLDAIPDRRPFGQS